MQRAKSGVGRWLASGFAVLLSAATCGTGSAGDAPTTRPRLLVSTDIGGTDPDDLQSMVHLLVYSDAFDIEWLISSPYGQGRKHDLLDVIDLYSRDYPNLKTYSDDYPAPQALRSIVKQGAIESAGYPGFGTPTEGSDWIVERARHPDPRPLWVLVWGGIDDLAQALHDAPDILPKLRVYFIGGPNKKWSADAYQYIVTHHPRLWIIEANATYRGWFTGGDQDGEWGNESFVATHVADCGSLGRFFSSLLEGTMKMGDSPSVGYLLNNTAADPSQPGWGGRFVLAWDRPYEIFERVTTVADRVEQFGVLELAIPLGDDAPGDPVASMLIGNQSLNGFVDDGDRMRFRFSPKNAQPWVYTIRSNVPALDGATGALTSFRPPPEAASHPSPRLPNWWTDDPAPEAAEGPDIGARTVSRWREDFLREFAARMLRCRAPADAGGE